jgi:hypothetical protein
MSVTVPPPQSLAAAAEAVNAPAPPAPAAPPAPPAPVVPQVSVADFEAYKAKAAAGEKAIAQAADLEKRMAQVANLLTGKTEPTTAALPPDVVTQLALAKATAEKASRNAAAISLAHQFEANNPTHLAAMVRDHQSFAVDDHGELLNQPAAVAHISAIKSDPQGSYLFKVAAVQQAQTQQGPGAGTRAPIPTAPNVSAPVKPAPPAFKSSAELRAMTIQAQREYHAAVKAAGGPQQ